MTRSENMEHVEVLRHMKETIKAIMQSEVAALDAAIASLSAPKPEGDVVVTRNEGGEIVAVTRQDAEGRILSVIAEAAPQPPAEAQPVDGLRMVKLSDAWDYAHGALSWNELDARAIRCPAEAQPVGGGEVVAWDNGSPCVESRPIGMVYPVKPAPRASGYLDSSGVEWNAYDTGQMEAYARAAYSDGWAACLRAARESAPPSAPVGVEELVSRAISQGKRLQWSAVMDTLERLRGTLALAQQPAAVGEEIMVNAAHDVYTLPLQPSGLSSGPRFVVHVPAPEQPAAVDEVMVRKVAKAINAEMEGTDDVGGAWKRLGSNERKLRDRMARAALAAQQGGGTDE